MFSQHSSYKCISEALRSLDLASQSIIKFGDLLVSCLFSNLKLVNSMSKRLQGFCHFFLGPLLKIGQLLSWMSAMSLNITFRAECDHASLFRAEVYFIHTMLSAFHILAKLKLSNEFLNVSVSYVMRAFQICTTAGAPVLPELTNTGNAIYTVAFWTHLDFTIYQA